MKSVKLIGTSLVLVMLLTLSVFAMTTIFSSRTVSSAGVTVTQTRCVNSAGTTVSAVYYLYNSAGDYSSKTLKGGSTSSPATGTLKPKAAYYGKAHTLYIEKGSGVTVRYSYVVN